MLMHWNLPLSTISLKKQNKAINTYPKIQYFLECYKTREMCDKAVNICFTLFHSVFNQCKTQEMSGRVVSEDPFMLIYCPDRCKTQDCLAALTFIPDWFVTIKMFEKYHDALLANDNILFFEEDFSKVTFFANEMGILGVDLDKLTLMMITIFMKIILKLFFMSDFWLAIIKYTTR